MRKVQAANVSLSKPIKLGHCERFAEFKGPTGPAHQLFKVLHEMHHQCPKT